MSRNWILASVFVISIVISGNFQAFASEGGKSDEEKVSPSPGPSPSVKIDQSGNNSDSLQLKSNQNPVGKGKLKGLSPQSLPGSNHSLDLPPKGSEKETIRNTDDTQSVNKTHETPGTTPKKSQEGVECIGEARKCADNGKLVACLQDPGSGSKEFFLLVKNEGDVNLTVNIRAPASLIVDTKELLLTKHQDEKVNISANAWGSFNIVLNAGNGDCILKWGQRVPISATDFFHGLPSFATYMTPIYGVYFLSLTVLIVGGTWACCKFGKRGRRVDGGVPYQELEMGLPQSSSAVIAETADGWDQGWDDDEWEVKSTTRTSEIRHVGNVSANGLTSRSPNRDGWDDGWDD